MAKKYICGTCDNEVKVGGTPRSSKVAYLCRECGFIDEVEVKVVRK